MSQTLRSCPDRPDPPPPAHRCRPVPTGYRIPAIIEVNSTLLVFAERRFVTCADGLPHSIELRRSTDGGRSWLPQQQLATVGPAVTPKGTARSRRRHPHVDPSPRIRLAALQHAVFISVEMEGASRTDLACPIVSRHDSGVVMGCRAASGGHPLRVLSLLRRHPCRPVRGHLAAPQPALSPPEHALAAAAGSGPAVHAALARGDRSALRAPAASGRGGQPES